jgi:hypothetical protein
VLINATPQAVFAYLADLPRHGEWDAQTGFAVVSVSDDPIAEGSFCARERIEVFQAPILRGGALANRVSWVRSLTVTGCETNQGLDFETKNLYNGLTIAEETVFFRLYSEGVGTVLEMTSGRKAYMPGPFHFIMLASEFIKSLTTGLFVGWLFRVFPRLRTNAQLSRIKTEVEKM